MIVASEKLSRGGGYLIWHRIISLENLFASWNEFRKDKQGKRDVQEFALHAEDGIFALHESLKNGSYQHGQYTAFYICDPKLRHIHKACVLDRIVHHAIVRVIEPFFEPLFIFDSYSSRVGKGTHKAFRRLRALAWKLSRNNTKTVWALKADVRKFFDSVNHHLLMKFIAKRIHDEKALALIGEVIRSFSSANGKGLPLGNVTSQLFANIYLNELDQFLKNKLRIKHYLRYADDFVILSRNPDYLRTLLGPISRFLSQSLDMELHPGKVMIRKWHQGIDFLGYVSRPYHAVLRTKTKRRILGKIRKGYREWQAGKIDEFSFRQSLQSYLGMLRHCRGYKIAQAIHLMAGHG